MQVRYNTLTLTGWTSVAVTVAVLAKTFVPFYLIGSTAIFAASVAVGLVLVALSWRPIFDGANHARDALVVAALFYTVIVVSFLAYSRAALPATHLWGILIIHGIMLIFGFTAARALKMVLLVLSGTAAIYAALLALHALRFGGITTGINIDDIFGIGVPEIYITFHQNIGFVLGVGVLAIFGLASNRVMRFLLVTALLIVLLLLFHIAARTALVALASSLIFLGFTALWEYSRKVATLTAAAVIVAATIAAGVLSQRALNQIGVDAKAPDAISRTIRELQDPNQGFRLPIWEQTWRHIVSDPARLPLGRGIGMYPIDAGFGAPDWLLHPTEGSKHYPHNVHLEILYDTGIAGLVLFSILTILPIIASLRRWSTFSPAEKSTVAIYVFNLVSSDISGAFAYTYMLQFFLALTVGIVALKRADDTKIDGAGVPKETWDPKHPRAPA
ncbi:O-antigen ligase [Bradyrhizobium sp. URHD0069]|uniref:O-antigen ligase family protein n=1 Tax=Bradyrhizobium sp. URHD0069 TaxID=1380355 RepID=UPI0009E07E6E|nr:O-antigen ligase family protein [Bradyrhizobium sp. URHD0069]